MNMKIRKEIIVPSFAIPILGTPEKSKIIDKVSALIARILAYFAQAFNKSQTELPPLEIKDPFAKLLEIQAKLKAPEVDLKACLTALAEIEAALPKIEERDKTDQCVADTVEMLFKKPQDTRNARFVKAKDALEEQAQMLTESLKRKERFAEAKEFMESRGGSLARRRNFLTGRQALEELGPSLFNRKEEDKQFDRAKAYLEKRSDRLMRGLQKRKEAAPLAALVRDVTYDVIRGMQTAHKNAQNSYHILQRKTCAAKTKVTLIEKQLEFLETQKLIQQARAGLSKVVQRADRFKLKLLASGRGDKAERARQELAAYESTPKELTNQEKRNRCFDTIIDMAKNEHKIIHREFKKRVKALDLSQDRIKEIISRHKDRLNQSLCDLKNYAAQVSKHTEKSLIQNLAKTKAVLSAARAKEESARGLLALEGKSAKDLTRTRMAYIGIEFSALSTIKTQINTLKKYDRNLAKYLAQTPVLEIEVN